ncbi:MAG TPA: ferredoxin [Acidimicrobiales bacterium]|nr:ferredoxin [Acidimicrobiales bacterium]
MRPAGSGRYRLEVDPIGCDGHGLCAEVAPGLVALDDWGYPMVASGDVPAARLRTARRAAAMCPKLALALRRADRGQAGAVVGSQDGRAAS